MILFDGQWLCGRWHSSISLFGITVAEITAINQAGATMLCNNQASPQLPVSYSAPLALRQKADIRVHGARRFATELVGPDSPQRGELEQFVRHVFRQAYGASIRHFMPELMSLRDEAGKLLAVCGLRKADAGPLFLETYLDDRVESVIADKTLGEVSRGDIVEIGNLAVAEPGIAPQLLASVSMYLHGTDTQWAVFTAIPVLRNSLSRLNVQLEVLADADLGKIREAERPLWGSYYDKRPQVMAVRRTSRPDSSHRSLVA
jgi:hypothetical protein